MGLPEASAALLQTLSTALVVIAVGYSALRLPSEASYLVAVIASQLVSPILWDHYAMLLLLPVAYLLERGQWWAIAVPLATSVLVLPFGMPAFLYPAAFWVTLLGVVVLGRRDRALVAAAVHESGRASASPLPA
jgi:hypothetical protein